MIHAGMKDSTSCRPRARLARAVEPLGVAWFEEPVPQLLRRARRAAAPDVDFHRRGAVRGPPLSAARKLMLASAVDVVQTERAGRCGHTEATCTESPTSPRCCACRSPTVEAGHTTTPCADGAVPNGHGVEMHARQWTLAETLYVDPPRVAAGDGNVMQAAQAKVSIRERTSLSDTLVTDD